MKIALTCLALLIVVAPVWGQAKIDACALIANPEKYADNVVEVKGIVYSSFEKFVLVGSECANLPYFGIWLDFADEQRVKDDDSLTVRNLVFKPSPISKKFEKLLNKKCSEVRVSATLRGFFQHHEETVKVTNTPNGNRTEIVGFGHMGMYSERLVIQSVEAAEALPCIEPQRTQETGHSCLGGRRSVRGHWTK